MSILDKLNVFLDNTALGASGISDTVDLGANAVTRNIGGPDAIYLVVQTGPIAATDVGSDATLRVQLASDSTDNLATSPTIHIDTGVLAFAAVAVANKQLIVAPLPLGEYERYMGIILTVASGPYTAGSLRAFLTRDPQYWKAFTANNPQFM